jgi:hypothetical protein
VRSNIYCRVVACVATMTVCAGAWAQEQTPAPKEAASSKPAASQVAPDTTEVPAAPKEQPAEQKPAEKKPFKVPAGYRAMTKDGVKYYCRRETPMGSRLAETRCYTQETLEQLAELGQSARDNLSQRTKACVPIESCGGT